MACRIGITTNPEKRKEEWKRIHPTMRNWTIEASGLSRTAAQAIEDRLAKNRGCEASPGGREPENNRNNWSVYSFDY